MASSLRKLTGGELHPRRAVKHVVVASPSFEDASTDDEDLVDGKTSSTTASDKIIAAQSLPPKLRASFLVSALGGKLSTSSSWTNWTVKLSSTAEITSTAGGIFSAAFAASPGTTTFSGYSTIMGLFDEVKCKALSLQFIPYSSSVAGGAVLAVGSVMNNTASPSSLSDVCDAQDAVLVSGTSTAALGHIHHMRYPTDIAFAAVQAPFPGPYAGAPGSIRMYGVSIPVSTKFGCIKLTATFHFRGRV
jgi:hypothetical protein